MAAAPAFATPYAPRGGARRRAVGLLVALAVNILLVLMLLRLAPPFERDRPHPSVASFGLIDTREVAAPQARARAVRQQARRAAAPRQSAQTRAPVSPAVRWPEGFVFMSREAFAASDIASMPHRAARSDGGAQGEQAANGGSTGAGSGPNGAQLFDADWYKRPTDAELTPYLPTGRSSIGSGLIACRTVERFRVEDCHILDESPAGSGLGRAVLNAAWQFRVLPPRVNGRPLIGSWVRIRIDYTERGAAAD